MIDTNEYPQLRSQPGTPTRVPCPECDNLLLPVELASIWRRLGAGIIDTAILVVIAGGLSWVLFNLVGAEPLLPATRGFDTALRLLELDPTALFRRAAPALSISALYFGLFWSLTGRTPGARVLRVRVIDEYGEPPGPIRTGVRVVGHFIGLLLGTLGWIWAAFDREARAWHDHLARTYVVRDA